MRTGIANLPLHPGKAPRWLFDRMKKLAREITLAIVEEYGPTEFVSRLADPFWFQSFGCVLGFDWHSSGVTTTTCGAIKEGILGLEHETGIYVAGGKGASARKTPRDIQKHIETSALSLNPHSLIYASKISAKIDSTAIQDGYQIYHHNFFFTADGNWAVVQQGMNEQTRYARRYHWLSSNITNYVQEPHTAICCDQKATQVLNLVAKPSLAAQHAITQISHQKPLKTLQELKKIAYLTLPSHHAVFLSQLKPESMSKVLLSTYEASPTSFEQVLTTKGLGPKSLRALTLLAEIIYGTTPSWQDPAKYSFAHGGKDGFPYPVDRQNYDHSIEILRKAVQKAKIGQSEKKQALQRLLGA